MELDCEGCAGCCLDWRPLVDGERDDDGRYRPLDDDDSFVTLTREDVRTFLEAGLGDALTARLFRADEGVVVGDETLAAVDGRPAYVVGLRKLPKPVAPFDVEPTWLPTCAFLDPTTLQCRIHGEDSYPADCADYPASNLALDAETECERVEGAFGGDRLLEDTPPEDTEGPALGPQAVGWKVFPYPDPEGSPPGHRSLGVDAVAAAADRSLSRSQRAPFVAGGAAGAPGTPGIDDDRYRAALGTVLAADSWVGRAAADWERRAGGSADPSVAREVEDRRGAPPTPGWDRV